LLLILLVTAPLHAEVVRVEVKSRTDILAGKSFGAVGSFEILSGKIYFAINPKNSAKCPFKREAASRGRTRRSW
jgi:hypothetical protein